MVDDRYVYSLPIEYAQNITWGVVRTIVSIDYASTTTKDVMVERIIVLRRRYKPKAA